VTRRSPRCPSPSPRRRAIAANTNPTALQPGDLGAIVRLHGLVYAAEHGLGNAVEVLRGERHGGERHGGARHGGVGPERRARPDPGRGERRRARDHRPSRFTREPDGTGRLRWFVVAPTARGRGTGRALLA